MSKVLHELHARTPLNREAGLVFAKGEVFEPLGKKQTTQDSVTPLPMAKSLKPYLINPQFKDLTGVKFGRFTVMGKSTEYRGWVVRCQCGMWSVRNHKAITKPNNTKDRCNECNYKLKLKAKHHFERFGTYNDDFFESL